jgi:hypothetical protein
MPCRTALAVPPAVPPAEVARGRAQMGQRLAVTVRARMRLPGYGYGAVASGHASCSDRDSGIRRGAERPLARRGTKIRASVQRMPCDPRRAVGLSTPCHGSAAEDGPEARAVFRVSLLMLKPATCFAWRQVRAPSGR